MLDSSVDLSNWNVGDEVVVASTGLTSGDSSPASETETRTISAVDQSLNKVTLTESLAYDHYGVSDQYTLYAPGGTVARSTTTVNLVGEVGLLTRNIKFQGADAEDSKYGAHLMLSSPGDETS